MNRLSQVLLVALLTSPLLAEPRPARDLVIPVAGRASGAFGSEWRTEVVVGNAGDKAVRVGVSFYPSLQFDPFELFELEPSATRTIPQMESRAGILGFVRITADDGDARIVAHARIYNSGGQNGEHGQIVDAIPYRALGRRVQVFGLRDDEGTRTNLGLMTPFWNLDGNGGENVTIRLLDTEGVVRSERTLEVNPVRQINDVFSFFGVQPAPGSVIATSSQPLAAYISILQTESGDADFIAGAAHDQAVSDVVTPPCAAPAPLDLNVRPAGGYIVEFTEDAGPTRELADALAAKYGFTIAHYFAGGSWQGFSATVGHEGVAALRCESAVRIIYEDTGAILL